jgi:hypothetical protein
MQAHRASSLRYDLAVLGALASVVLVAHAVVGNGYGFHRDELQTLSDVDMESRV